ncbi:hypothetical protein L3N51_01778 [Metallosphaera sp. J1]|uniref:HepT-like ribonuclease domain-containing protein n=1 Tax=Metallosphaera javensis (ex Hofmann et al. 2022) TaxID=99938 RepID=UPI001EDF74C7|nr:HepT-like ribonuclease domain-containing protein [Metallosphaera javensis (ex Hofmann et al. 2022)]MCG3109486.1 hypothetical protein [Metallosphaera javensis (ex Hofmann et al. 2022)]
MSDLLELSQYLERLRAFNWRDFNVYYAVLFGSLAKNGKGEDVSVAAEFKSDDPEMYRSLLHYLMKYLDLEKVNLVMISDSTDCSQVHEVFSYSLILYLEDYDRMYRRASICEDFLMDMRKIETNMKRWSITNYAGEGAMGMLMKPRPLNDLLKVIENITEKLNNFTSGRGGLTGWEDQMVVLHSLQIQAQALIDLGASVLFKMNVKAQKYKDIPIKLESKGLIDKEDKNFMNWVINFRNNLVHEYSEMDLKTVEEILNRREYMKLLEIAMKLKEKAREYWDP